MKKQSVVKRPNIYKQLALSQYSVLTACNKIHTNSISGKKFGWNNTKETEVH
jgi:hypothetical protein